MQKPYTAHFGKARVQEGIGKRLRKHPGKPYTIVDVVEIRGRDRHGLQLSGLFRLDKPAQVAAARDFFIKLNDEYKLRELSIRRRLDNSDSTS